MNQLLRSFAATYLVIGFLTLPGRALGSSEWTFAPAFGAPADRAPDGPMNPEQNLLSTDHTGPAAPATLSIQTVPALAEVSFEIDGRRFSSNESGVASIEVFREGIHQLEALPLESNTADRRLEFARWGDAVFNKRREILVSGHTLFEAGFNVQYALRLEFSDLNGRQVPSGRVESVLLRNSIGDVHSFAGEGPVWVQSNQVVFRDVKLDAVDIVYTVQSVVVDGSNVVNRGQQRFSIATSQTQTIELLLYPALFHAKDALFGHSIGQGILLEYPDGHRWYFPFVEDSSLHVNSLARGTYRATVAGASGLAIPAVFVLSREQEVTALVISALDMIVVAAIAVSVLLGLLFAGRPRLLKSVSEWIRRTSLVFARK
jgi:hypothetical protein